MMIHKCIATCLLIGMALVALALAAPQAVWACGGGVICVDANAPGLTPDGLSWMTAFTNMQDALIITVAGNEIWVAEGIYTPTARTDLADARTATFMLTPGVAIYGGFSGYGISETLRTQRDWTTHVTVLSGDIDGNDTTDAHGVITNTADISGTNAYHVVTSSSVTETAVLDGFTITAGNANGDYSYDRGGGMYNYYSNPVLTNIIFSGNQASSNHLGGGGGGMHNWNSNPVLINVTFGGNQAIAGGGMYNYSSNPVLTDVIFNGNQAGSGGGIYNNYSNPTLTNTTFSGNQAVNDGGGMDNLYSSPTLTNIIFSGNQAGIGGGIYNYQSNPMVTNVTLSDNRADDYPYSRGGGIYNGSSNPTLVNCILWGNAASTDGPQIYNNSASSPTITYSDVQGGYPGVGNINADPQFVLPIAASSVPTTAGDYRLRSTSPAIDAGNSFSVTMTTDLDGASRKADMPNTPNTGIGIPPVDMGAYEAHALYVDVDAPGPTHDGLSWTTAYTTVQDALDYTNVHTTTTYEIWIAEGIYYPDEGGAHTNNNRSETFRLSWNNVQLYGGFAGYGVSETLRTQRDWVAHITILSGDIDHNDSLDNGNAYRVFYLDGETNEPITATTVIDGLTITAGYADGSSPDDSGGGLYCAGNGSGHACSPMLTNVTFSGNYAYYYGGMYNSGADSGESSPKLTNVTFSDNRATQYCGGMLNNGYLGASNPTLINVTFSGNYAGSGIDSGGGGMCNGASNSTLINVTFSGNYADLGGGMYNWGSNPTLVNVTFSGNRANFGGGMYNGYESASNPTLVNSILWGNTAVNAGAQIYNSSDEYAPSSTAAIHHSLVEGGCPVGATCDALLLTADPQFVTPIAASDAPTTTGDYRLHCGSPTIDAGNTSSVTVATDRDGNPRVVRDAVDMGAYEKQLLHTTTCLSLHKRVTPALANPGDTITYTLAFENHTVTEITATHVYITDIIPTIVAVQDIASSGVPITDTGTTPAYVWQVADLAPGQGGIITITAVLNAAAPHPQTFANTAVITSIAAEDYLPDNGSTANIHMPGVIYVDTDAVGAATGFSWTDAYTTVQDALTVAKYGDEVWVAEGYYYPDEGVGQSNNDRASTFAPAPGVVLYGGFAGIETEHTQRDWAKYVTVLSGDIDQDSIMENNAYHVLYLNGEVNEPITETTVIDGFTITAGYADGGHNGGGGLHCAGSGSGHECSPMLTNVVFTGNWGGDNWANNGGGMYNDGNYGKSNPMLVNVTFSGNMAIGHGACGGGMYNFSASPVLTNVTFSDNQADYGGGMYDSYRSNPTLTNVTFSGNQAGSGGGGVFNSRSSPTLTNVTFSGNQAGSYGGGMYNLWSSPALMNVTFSDNQAGSGGGIYSDYDSNPTLVNVTFSGNQAYSGGGMRNDWYSDPTLTDVIFSGNQASSGGGMYNDYYSSPMLTNVTLSGNQADNYGGGMYNSGGYPMLFNCILWGNSATTGTQIYNRVSTPTITYSDVQWPSGIYTGTGNINADPQFVASIAASSAPTTTGDYRLRYGSPAIDAGNSLSVTVSTDLDGNPRKVDATNKGIPIVDMGAYEFQIYTLSVRKAGSGDGVISSSKSGTLVSPYDINCGVVCSATYAHSTIVMLNAQPFINSTFAGWNGHADCTDGIVTMDTHKTCTATFSLNTYTLTVNIEGNGSVRSTSGTMIFPMTGLFYGTVVTLTATPDPGWTFAGWSGACSGADDCVVTIDADKTVTATFASYKIYLPLVLRDQ